MTLWAIMMTFLCLLEPSSCVRLTAKELGFTASLSAIWEKPSATIGLATIGLAEASLKKNREPNCYYSSLLHLRGPLEVGVPRLARVKLGTAVLIEPRHVQRMGAVRALEKGP